MTTKQLHSFRLTSDDEPTDEMLQAIMDKVAEEARKTTAFAQAEHLRRLSEIKRNKKL